MITRVAIRVDASSRIGSGHVMRCIVLAEELRSRSCDVVFVSRYLLQSLAKLLKSKNFKVVDLKSKKTDEIYFDESCGYSGWLGVSQEQDADDTLKELIFFNPHILVVDHYSLDQIWEKKIRTKIKKIMVIDDLANRSHDCDILLDQNYYVDMQSRYKSKVPDHCFLLLGPRYALLRKEFSSSHFKRKPRSGYVKKILIFFGGVDSKNYTSIAINALVAMKIKGGVDVVVSFDHPYLNQIKELCDAHNYLLHIQPLNLAELMTDADFSIGAGGVALWERCSVGLPTLSICTAENQHMQISDASELGILYSPNIGDDLLEEIRFHTSLLFNNPSLLRLISKLSIKEVDGLGAKRVVNSIGLTSIKIKKACSEDSMSIFEWRNHEAVKVASKNSNAIKWPDHQLWMDFVLSDKNSELIIGYVFNKPLGVCRFEIYQDVAEISIYLVPNSGFYGKGQEFLLAAERWLKKNRLDIREIRAIVLGKNLISQKLFLGANYETENIIYKKIL